MKILQSKGHQEGLILHQFQNIRILRMRMVLMLFKFDDFDENFLRFLFFQLTTSR